MTRRIMFGTALVAAAAMLLSFVPASLATMSETPFPAAGKACHARCDSCENCECCQCKPECKCGDECTCCQCDRKCDKKQLCTRDGDQDARQPASSCCKGKGGCGGGGDKGGKGGS